MSQNIPTINQAQFSEVVLQSTKLTLVDFFASWCGPCKMMAPILDEVASELKDVVFVKVDVDVSGDLAGQYNISSIPTFLLFLNGKVINQLMGAVGKAQLTTFIKKI